MKIVIAGFANIEGHFVAKRHLIAALESANREVLASLPKDPADVTVVEGRPWGGNPNSLVLKAQERGIPTQPLEALLTPEVMDGLKAALESSPSLESTERKLLESLKGEPTLEQLAETTEELKAKVTPRRKKTTAKKRRSKKEVKKTA